MLHIDYFNTILNNIENAKKLTPKLIKEYKEFRRQFDVAKHYEEIIEKKGSRTGRKKVLQNGFTTFENQ